MSTLEELLEEIQVKTMEGSFRQGPHHWIHVFRDEEAVLTYVVDNAASRAMDKPAGYYRHLQTRDPLLARVVLFTIAKWPDWKYQATFGAGETDRMAA